MNTNPPPERCELHRRHTGFRIACVAAFPIVALGGWCIHVYVLPLPIGSLWAGIARFAYFLLWLGYLFFLLVTGFFGYVCPIFSPGGLLRLFNALFILLRRQGG